MRASVLLYWLKMVIFPLFLLHKRIGLLRTKNNSASQTRKHDIHPDHAQNRVPHNTLQQYLEKLLAKGLVERRKQPTESPGRPTYVYNIPEDLKGRPLSVLLNPRSGWVVLSFDVLRRLCRHEKGGYCKEMRGRCGVRKCPKIVK